MFSTGRDANQRKAADLQQQFVDASSSKVSSQPYISYAVADVTQYDDILQVLKQRAPAAVVWAATSSGVKKGGGGGGDALQVDFQGAYYTAKVCLACHVPKLALISAGCVTRPNAPGARAVNFLTQWTYGECPWTDAKMAGETAVRDLYHRAAANKKEGNNRKKKQNNTYVIVRPAAALANHKPAIPVDQLVVMQGDVYSSAEAISRTNVAQVVVHALLKGTATDFVTFEVAPAVRLYKNDKGNVLDLVGLPTLKQTTVPDLPKPLVHLNAASYEELLEGLVTDDDMLKQYGSIVSDYRGGEKVPSVEDFA